MKVLVLVVDGLHAGYVGTYGNDWVGTPALDRLAAEGVVFDQHYADRPDPAGARRAWRTGRYAFPLPGGETFTSLPRTADLVAALRAAGVVTSLVCDHFASPGGFDQGWDTSRIVDPEDPNEALEAALEAVGEALDELHDSPHWLLWVELNTLLPPWTFPDEFFDDGSTDDDEEPSEEADESDEEEEEFDAEETEKEEDPLLPLIDPPTGPLGDDPEDATFLRLQRTYAAAVRYLDAGVEQLLDDLTKQGLLDELVLVVTTDRGAVLGEHGQVGVPRPQLHEELLHLPLIVRQPGREREGRRIEALTQPVDLLPTLLELFQAPAPADIHGHSLVPFLRGNEQPVRDYACAGLQVGLSIEWALRTPRWAYLLPLQGEMEDAARPPQLYAKPEDRWEVNDVQQHHQELTEHLRELLHDFVKAAQQPGAFVPPRLRDTPPG